MSFFNQLGKQQTNPVQMMQQLRADPAGFLRQVGLNVPAGITDPQQMINHLMQSGQVSQQRYQQAMQLMQGMKR